MDILLISDEDMCRSRIAQELLNSFGKGMKVTTAGICEGSYIPDLVSQVMEEHGYMISKRRPQSVSMVVNREWDYIVTLSKEADDEFHCLPFRTRHYVSFSFTDALNTVGSDEFVIKSQIEQVFEELYHDLYEFYRDVLSDELMPRCTCGANTYCRCE